MKNLVYAFSLLFLISCNPLKTLTNGDTDLDKGFFEGESNNDLYNDLVSFWRFDETGSTESRYDNQGTNHFSHSIGTINYVSGKHGNALDCSGYSGSNNFALNGTSGMAFGTAQDFTVAFWVKINSFTAGEYILKLDATSSGFDFTTSGSSEITFWIDGQTISSSVGTGSWHHIAVVVDRDSDFKMYLNGSHNGEIVHDSTGYSVNDASLMVCAYNNTTGYFNGAIDSAGVWGRMLSPEEISDLYNGYNNLD